MKQTTAILIFARTPEEEVLHKGIAHGAALFEELNKQVLQKAKASGIPYFLFTEKEQEGITFGDRFVGAIRSVFKKGFDQIITIGNDTPQLTAHHLREAQKQLNRNACVLGRSQDGGFYLMGLHQDAFQESAFLDFPWQTASLTSTMVKHMTKEKLRFDFLETLTDIDSAGALEKILSHIPASFKKLRKIILQILKEGISLKIWTFVTQPGLQFITLKLYNKGSPFIGPRL